MENFKKFYASFGFIISFLLLCIIISATMGQKFLSKFLMLVFVSQIILNSDEAIKLIEKTSVAYNANKAKEAEQKTTRATEKVQAFQINSKATQDRLQAAIDRNKTY